MRALFFRQVRREVHAMAGDLEHLSLLRWLHPNGSVGGFEDDCARLEGTILCPQMPGHGSHAANTRRRLPLTSFTRAVG